MEKNINKEEKLDVGNQFVDQSDIPKLRLSLFSKDEEAQLKYLVHIALTFRAGIPLLSELFQIDEKELLNLLSLNFGGGTYNALKYLFWHDNTDQEEAKKAIVAFYYDLLNAIEKRDFDSQRHLISIISDKKINEFKKNRISGASMSEDDIKAILKYQLKYALNFEDLRRTFKIHRGQYQIRVQRFLETHPDLKEPYEQLVEYNLKKKQLLGFPVDDGGRK